jgi:hypothetical protein
LAILAFALGAPSMAQETPKQAGTADKGLLGHWAFDEGQGSVAHDSSGRGHHGEIHEGQWVKGPFGVALRFNGESSFVSIPAVPELDGSDQMTLEAWAFWEGMGQYPNIVTGGTWNPGGFLLFVSDDHCSFRMGKPGREPWELRKTWQESGAIVVRPVSLGRWYRLSATFNRPTITTYLNGAPAGSASWNYPVGCSGPILIGKWELGRTLFHCGLIDEVKIYNRALTPTEIRTSYEKAAPSRK